MKAVTIAAASAAILGSTVSAGSHVENMHKQLHARSGWNDWSSSAVAESSKPADLTSKKPEASTTKPTYKTTTSSKPAEESSSTWADWSASSSPAVETTTSSKYDPSTMSWEDWSSTTTSSDPVKITSTTSKEESSTWADWSATSSDPVKITSTSSKEESSTWADWSASSSSPADLTSSKYDPSSVTWEDWSKTSSDPVKITSTSSAEESKTWADWSATSSDPAVETVTSTWADWSATSSDPAVETEASTWADWSSTVVKSGTTTTTIYLGKPTGDASSSPADLTATSTWADWSATSSDPAVETAASSTWADWAATSSAPAPAWSSDGWFGPGWGASDGQCAMQVVTSYGSPIWAATPEASLPVLSVTVSATPAEETAASSTWADWSATSSDPAVETAASSTWADWSATSSTPSVETTTSTSTWADWSATSSDPAVETATSTWADWSATSSDPSVETTTSATWADWSSSSSTPSVETATSSSTWAEWSAVPTGGLGDSTGNTWGMTYSPYTSEGGCKDAGTVESDIAELAGKGFSTVRVYSTDCSTLENVGTSARNHGIKMILGVFISKTGIEASKEQVWDIINWGQWDLVELIVIGNEAVFNKFCSASELAAYIKESADFFKKAGYTGPTTTTEPLAEWTSEGSAFCDVVDVVSANLYAFFNAQTTADKAGDFISAQIKELEWVCPGKETYVMESGWPHAGECNGVACPSEENQATAIKSIQEVTGSKVIFFSFEDEAWKESGEFGVEQYWGCSSVF